MTVVQKFYLLTLNLTSGHSDSGAAEGREGGKDRDGWMEEGEEGNKKMSRERMLPATELAPEKCASECN